MNERRLENTPAILAQSRLLLLLLLALALAPVAVRAQTPQYMSYQGYLTDGNGNALGSTNTGPRAYDVVFRIWDLPTGGTIGGSDDVFAELQTVTVDNGYFSVLLGQGTSYQAEPHGSLSGVFTNIITPRYVEMTVLGIGVSGASVTILPRLQLVDAPYALLAINAVNITGTNVVTAANLSTNVGLWQVNGTNIYRAAGNVGIGTTTPTARLGVTGTASGVLAGTSIDPSVFLRLYNTSNDGSGNGDAAGIAFGQNSTRQAIVGGTYGSDFLDFYTGGMLTAPKMHIDFNGNVGIGTNVASAPLHVVSSGDPSAIINSSSPIGTWLDLQNTGGGTNWDIISTGSANGGGPSQLIFCSALAPNSTSDTVLTLNAAGNVGIGTLTPSAALDVIGGVQISSNSVLQLGAHQSGQESNAGRIGYEAFTSDSLDIVGAGTNVPSRKIKFWAEGGANFTGSVGIGTTTPSVPLEVDSYSAANWGQYGFLNNTTPTGIGSGAAANVSIRAAQRILAAEFDAISDSRTKEIIGQSAGPADLQTIQKLRVTDYRMKDRVAHGDTAYKGFIAQEVETVIPEAVTKSRQFVPDIYAAASEAKYDPAAKTVAVTMAKAHGLKDGDKVRLMTGAGQMDLTVSSVPSEQGFVAANCEKDPGKVFVFGKEVNDFRTLNYDRIFTTGISAMQELARRVSALEAHETERVALEKRAAQVDNLEREVEQLKKLVAQLAVPGKGERAAAQPTTETASLNR